MVKSFLVSMFAIFLFTLGAAGAWFYIQMSPAADETADGDMAPTGQLLEEPDPIPERAKVEPLKAVIRGPDLNPEEVVRLNMTLSARQEQFRQQEEALRERRLQIETSTADTKAAQRDVEGALAQSRHLLDETEKLLTDVQKAVADLKKQSEDLKKRQEEMNTREKEMGDDVAANIKTFAEYMQGMPAETAAETFKEMINDGKMDYAIQLLKRMEARNVAKILAELKDYPLVAEIASQYSSQKKYR